jgi:hypothetical protein
MVAMGYPAMHTHGASERVKIDELVYGASDDVPATFTLHPHNEQAYLAADENPSYPRKLFFCCTVEPLDGAGGETPIVNNMRVTRQLEETAPELLAKFKEHGVRYDSYHEWGELDAPMELNLGGKQSWQKLFNTTEEGVAQQRAVERGYDFKWVEEEEENKGGRGAGKDSVARRGLQLYWTRPATMRETNSDESGEGGEGDDWWFNQASNVFSFKPSLGNGELISDDDFELLNEALWKVGVLS